MLFPRSGSPLIDFFGEIHETCINSNNSFINKACICSGQWPEFIFGKHCLNLDLNT